jgi:peroxiredoxin
LSTISGAEIAVPSDVPVHLQFRRFAGCPICNLHLRAVASRYSEIAAAGITEVVVFHSAAEELRRYQADLPFAVIADPERKLYREFGVEPSIRSILHPKAWRAGARGMRWTTPGGALGLREAHLGMPADFLIASDGTVRACKYGTHADDQWSVDEILALGTQ